MFVLNAKDDSIFAVTLWINLYHIICQKMENINQIIWEMKKENKKSDPKILNKFLWVMVGGAVWDALWAPFEFLRMGEFEREDGEYHDDGRFQEGLG